MPLNLSDLNISELVCTRISHDLIGNIGAVANAVELMDDDPECLADVKPILEISSATLTARLKFFRLAFGLGNTGVKTVAEIDAAAKAYLASIGSRTASINLEMQLQTPQLYKLVLLGLMSLADVFIRGGKLQIVENNQGLILTAMSETSLSVGKLQTMQSVLQGVAPEENPAQSAPLLYLLSLLRDKGVHMHLTFTEKEAVLQIV